MTDLGRAATPGEPSPPPPATPAPATARGLSLLAWVAALALAAVVGTLLFLGGYLSSGAGSSTCAAPSDAFAAFCQAYDKLKSEHVDELDDEALAEGAIKGMFEYGVDDPYSGYMAPEEYQRALGDLSGKFEGIGAEMAMKNLRDPADLAACDKLTDTCVMVVVAPLEGSPAERAGLLPGDIVTAVDGESVEGSTLHEQVNKVRGPAGTEVTLTLRRGAEVLDVTIERAEIQLLEVASRLLDERIGYIKLSGFSTSATEQFADGLGQLLEDGAQQIVFDLRGNPGGYIEAARAIASQFIGEGVIFSQESAGDQVKTWTAEGAGLATDPAIEVVLLTNGGTASASEIVTAALKEHDRATVIGQPTFGKDTVQVWGALENGGGVRITISRWFTPEHNSVAPSGIAPDIVVETPAGTAPESDPVLDRAIAFLESRPIGDVSLAPADATARPGGQLVPVLPSSYDPRGLTQAAA